MLSGTLSASLFVNILTGQGINRAEKGGGKNRAGEGALPTRQGRGIVRAGYGYHSSKKNKTDS